MVRIVGLLTLLIFGLLTPAWAADEQIVQQLSANGSRTIRPFTVKDGWEVRWKTDKDVDIYLVDPNGDLVDKLASSDHAGTGSTYHAKGGTYSLKISTRGNWTITVVQLP